MAFGRLLGEDAIGTSTNHATVHSDDSASEGSDEKQPGDNAAMMLGKRQGFSGDEYED